MHMTGTGLQGRRVWGAVAAAALGWLIIGSGIPAEAADTAKIGYGNLAKVFDEYQRTKDSEVGLEQRGKQKQSQLESQFNELKKIRQGLELMNDQAREVKTREIEEKSDEFKRQKTQTERELLGQRNTIAKQILDEISAVVTEYGKANGFTLILDQRTVLYGQEVSDVTDEVLKNLNERYAARATKKAAAKP